ncbi:MAG: hypothetical protein ITG00_09005, partial [Flavobacterium sp.]|nr:hypothetical protein [Flavobacterium sp.]
MKKLLLICLLLPLSVFAQLPLAGSYLVGAGQPAPFNTLTNAVNRINSVGVSSPVTFLLNDATYNVASGETFPIRITNYQGSSATNTLTIRPNVGKTVTISAGENAMGWMGVPATIQLDGADNVIVNGSTTAGGTTRNLTINNSNGVDYASRTAIWVSSNGANAANNISVLNANISMTNVNGTYLIYCGIFAGGNTVDSSNGLMGVGATAANSALTFQNNVFTNVRHGIIIKGGDTAGLATNGVQIVNNIWGSTVAAQKPVRAISLVSVNNFNIIANTISGVLQPSYHGMLGGIEVENGNNFTIKNNILNDLLMTNNSNFGNGIYFKGIVTNGVISENKLSNIKNTGGGIIRGIAVEIDPLYSANLTIANNFISDVASNGTTTNTGYGLQILSGRNIKVYHNSISMNTAQAGTSAAMFVGSGSEFDVRNNILHNTGTATRFALHSQVNASAYTFLNNNNYFSSPIGRLGSADYATLANWKSATGKDQASISVNPVFTSLSDLHLPTGTNAALDNKGSAIAAVTTDIDGTTRSLSTPDIGADEFSSQVMAAEPATQATGVSFANITSTSFTINWTSGAGTRRLVVVRAGTAVNADPTDAAAYTPSTTFGNGSQIGSGNYVVYANTGSSVTISNLLPATSYHVAVYEYNGTAGAENYRLTPARGNRTTLNSLMGWQVAAINTAQSITFDTTVSNVNQGVFNGSGFKTAPVEGQLNSNAWSVTGLADGNVNFNSNMTTENSAKGISNGGVAAGGIYGFQVSANNYALGLQPDADDFIPGSVVLRTQNQTGSTITSLSVGYKVYVYNDQPGAGNFTFSHSGNNLAFTAIPEIDVVSDAAPDGNPSWKANFRVVTITGLNIPANSYYYLRWSTDAISGATFDEFALDDITLSANPSTNFANFSGTAANFIVHGNTALTGATTVENLTLNNGKLSINGQTLTIAGPVNNIMAGGLRGSATSNVTLTGSTSRSLSFDQAAGANVLNNFSIPFGTSKTIAVQNPIIINGSLTVALDQTLNMGTNALTGTLNGITINGTLQTQNTSPLPLPSGKVWAGNGSVVYNALTQQRVVAGTYNGLSVSSPGGGIASGDITVNGPLILPVSNPSATVGALDMGTFTLLMGPNAVNSGIGDVSGVVRRDIIAPYVVYTFGHQDTSITFPNIGTLPTTMSLKISLGIAPAWKPTAVKRMYDLIQTGAADTKAVIKSHYLDSELNGNDENKLVDWARIVGPPSSTLEQGRSNFDAINNYVELMNVNIGLYFQNTFGKVSLTMAASEAEVLTWNGSTSNSWTTAANWTPNATPSDDTAVIIPDAATTTNDPIFNELVTIKSLNIETGGVINAPALSVVTIKGAGGAWINNGQLNAVAGSTVVFTNADATIAGTTQFSNLTIAQNATLRPATGSTMRIGKSLTINGSLLAGIFHNTVEYTGTNQTVALTNTNLNAYHNLTISGTGALFPTSLNIKGDLILNQTVDFSGKSLTMNGQDEQIIGGSALSDFNNLIIDKPTGDVTLQASASVSGLLTMNGGNLLLGSNNLTVNSNAIAGAFSASRMIIIDGEGELRRKFTGPGTYLYPIGENTGNSNYTPISVTIAGSNFANAYVGVRVVDAIHPANGSTSNNLSRYWQVRQSGISNAVANISATYILPDLTGEQATVSAAVLAGTFDQQTNPWVKYQPLENQNVAINDIPLENGQLTAISGIKTAVFSASVSGQGIYCENSGEVLTAVTNNGDMPFTYSWSNGMGTAVTATPPSTIGTAEYTVIIKDANGLIAQATASIETVAEAIAGSLSANQ